jgi:hypothetical protein
MTAESDLTFVIYLSRISVHFDDQMLVDLAAKSSVNNKNRGVTGILLRAGNHFIQILEGPNDMVHRLVNKIRGDFRHTDLRIIYEESIENRRFGESSMKYLPIEGIFNVGVSEVIDLKRSAARYLEAGQDLSSIVNFIKCLPAFFLEHKVEQGRKY